ncbi:MAG: 3-dehydroquinate synthase, partial [Candidatus Aureabacteria bacterium]|nr:3-dehydroquinate synthase [Candidatus Auribacterota bacterium]
IITDKNVNKYYGSKLLSCFKKKKIKTQIYVLPAGEKTKSSYSLKKIYDFMLKKKCDRRSAIIALGGGVIGDLAGFAAATFMRGIDFFQIPTSLMAQVDSSVGGKTGIDLKQGKNLVGAFHQPRAVFADPCLLMTLPEKEYISALSEVIKYGIIMDRGFFCFLEKNIKSIKSREMKVMEEVVKKCLQLKAEVVMKDELESGLRAILNLGHTFGHAYEALSEYKGLSHGYAVGNGIIIAARISTLKGLLSKQDLLRIENIFYDLGFSSVYPPKDFKRFFAIMSNDKKSLKGKNRFILPDGIGKTVITEDVSAKEIKQIFRLD